MPPLDPENWRDRDAPLNVEMDPETALRALLAVDPNAPVVEEEEED
jgi:hypothetical protein